MRPPDLERRNPPGANQRVSVEGFSIGIEPSKDTPAAPHNQWPRHIGVVAADVLRQVGYRAIAYNLDQGRFDDANRIRATLGMSWSDLLSGRRAA